MTFRFLAVALSLLPLLPLACSSADGEAVRGMGASVPLPAVASIEGGGLDQSGRPGQSPILDVLHAAGLLQSEPGDLSHLSDASRSPADSYVFRGPGAFPSFPLPDGDPVPLGPGVFRSGFREPLPRSPVWNPPGAKRVGLQVGHWFEGDLPHELRRLSPGSSAGGWAEWELNHLIARHTARLLEEAGVETDLLPSTIPVRYRAHAFVAVHADGDTSGRLNGYKLARPGFSSIPDVDDEFVRILYEEYGKATGLPRDSDQHVSRRMIYYYAFNTRRYQHAVDLGTPAAIIEAGFLTHAGDRAFLTSRPELAARGIANGILRFLELEYGAPREGG